MALNKITFNSVADDRALVAEEGAQVSILANDGMHGFISSLVIDQGNLVAIVHVEKAGRALAQRIDLATLRGLNPSIEFIVPEALEKMVAGTRKKVAEVLKPGEPTA
jgi:hypothetical protein